MPLPTAPPSSGPWACSESRVVAMSPQSFMSSFQCLQRPECHPSELADAAAAAADHSELGNPVSVCDWAPATSRARVVGQGLCLGNKSVCHKTRTSPVSSRAAVSSWAKCQSSPAQRQNLIFGVTCCRLLQGEFKLQAGSFCVTWCFGSSSTFQDKTPFLMFCLGSQGPFPELWHTMRHKPQAWYGCVP